MRCGQTRLGQTRLGQTRLGQIRPGAITAALRGQVIRLGGDECGSTVVEFAVVAPVMLILIMGLGELSYQAYMQAILTGAMQLAGRTSTIQGATTTTIDASVLNQMQAANGHATGVFTRQSFSDFTQVGPEPFTDTNGDGKREVGECYSDINGNGQYDTAATAGSTGNGGASDSVVYTATISYPRIFAFVPVKLGWSQTATISATTILKNQPFAIQTAITTPATICT